MKPIRDYPKDPSGFLLIPASVWRDTSNDYKGKNGTTGERQMMGLDEVGRTCLFPVRIVRGK